MNMINDQRFPLTLRDGSVSKVRESVARDSLLSMQEKALLLLAPKGENRDSPPLETPIVQS